MSSRVPDRSAIEATDGADRIVRLSALSIPMRDGVDLVAEVWVPDRDRPWPTLVQRLPYGRSVASTPVLPHPEWFARRGYAVVVADVRGRGDSGGYFRPFADDGNDGYDTIEWAAAQPFSDGRVATYGFSYQGLNQLAAAALRPPSLCGIAPMMCADQPFEGWTYEHGCLRWEFVTFWAGQLAGQEPLAEPTEADRAALPAAAAFGDAPPPWWKEWIEHSTDDEFWRARSADLTAIEVPAFTVLGYFDDFAAGTHRLFRALSADGVCGPWQHMPWGTRHGDVELGAAAGPSVAHRGLIEFFDRVFADPTDRSADSRRDQAVRYFDPVRGWRTAPTWPPPTERSWWHARSGGSANSRHGDGELVADDDGSAASLTDVIVSEPLVPYPGSSAALSDESAAEDRRDVLCYTSAPLEQPISVAGVFEVEVDVSADVATHDVVVSIVVVDETDTARRLTSRACRTQRQRGSRATVTLDVGPVAWTLLPGERLRVDVSASRFPAYERNPQCGAVAAALATRQQCRVATINVHRLRVGLPIASSRIGAETTNMGGGA